MTISPWHTYDPGTVLAGNWLTITEEHVDGLVALGGFVHPLFTDPQYVRDHSPLSVRPLPGTAVLHLMGGLAEQHGALDGSVLALLGFSDVSFRSPVLVGDQIRLELELAPTEATKRADRELLPVWWRAVRPDGEVVAQARATMLVARPA